MIAAPCSSPCFSSIASALRYHCSAPAKSRLASWAIDPQLVIGDRRAVLVPLLLLDRQRLAVPLLRTREVALLLGDPPQLVIGARRAVLVPLLLLDRQRLAVPLLRTREVALLLGDHPQLVIGARFTLRVPVVLPRCRKPLEQMGRLLEVPGVLGMGRQRLDQRREVEVHLQALGLPQGNVEIRTVQEKRPTLLVKLPRCQIVGQTAHQVHEGAAPALAWFAGGPRRAGRAEEPGQGGVHLENALAPIVQEPRHGQRTEEAVDLRRASTTDQPASP